MPTLLCLLGCARSRIVIGTYLLSSHILSKNNKEKCSVCVCVCVFHSGVWEHVDNRSSFTSSRWQNWPKHSYSIVKITFTEILLV